MGLFSPTYFSSAQARDRIASLIPSEVVSAFQTAQAQSQSFKEGSPVDRTSVAFLAGNLMKVISFRDGLSWSDRKLLRELPAEGPQIDPEINEACIAGGTDKDFAHDIGIIIQLILERADVSFALK